MSMIQPGILADAADYIDQHGWTQGQFETDDGKVCLLGAVRRCTPIPGDRHLVEQVMHRRRRADVWNDAKDRTADEVTAYLREHADVTDEELADTFGPQWREIVAQVRAVSGATQQQIVDLAAAGAAAGDAAWAAAWDAARDAARALTIRDLISTNGYTQAHYDLLTGPWRQVMGPLHADDDRPRPAVCVHGSPWLGVIRGSIALSGGVR